MGENAKFTAVLEGNVSADGEVLVPAGSKVYGQLFAVKKSRRLAGRSEVTLALVQMNVGGNIVKIETSGVRAVGEKKAKSTAGKVAAGAAVGAMFGGGAGAAKGAAVGATAALATQGNQINIPAGTLLDFTLADSVEVKGGGPAKAAPSSAAAPSVDPTELALKVAEARTRSGKAMLAYNWKQRTEVERAGKSEYVKLELVRYDADANLQRTPMSESGKVQGAAAKLVEAVSELRGYALPSAGSLLDFMRSADVSSIDGAIVAIGQSVLQPGDRLTLQIDPETFAITRADVRASLDGQPAMATIDYTTKDEVVFPSLASIRVGDDLELVIEVFDVNEG